jgi:uncharacterized membrane protein YqjE
MLRNKLLEILGIEKIVHSLQGLVETRVALIKEEVEEKVVSSIVKAVPLVLVMLSATLFVFFASITLGLYLSVVTGNTILGFGIVTAFYFLLGIIVYLMRNNKAFAKVFDKQIRKKRDS